MSTSLFEQIIEPFAECLTPEAAQKIVAIRADAATQARIDELADKANHGLLTEAEKADYDRYLATSHFVSLLQARARKIVT
ncbi:hypothetical protein [Anatilimnocola aggregata]|uniref:hypothetical protein n=1 Tax=Anatilimnocola aggregata TaxID=2528021 RepID=UPI0011A75518|nr:hypothetical protein [Anatilimnocola aggregata]